ncbi:MAG: histidine phosphatase family protein [bacterium]|nr:histidine phosphatase family protein [bacterium]
MTKLLLIRHAQSLWNLENKAQGHLDSPLTDLGVKQSKLLANYLKDKNICKIYSSNLGRALSTAKIISKNIGISIEEVADLREIMLGEWEGMVGEEIANKYKDIYHNWFRYPSKTLIPQGESIEELRKRIIPAFYNIINKHDGETIAVVSHGGVIVTFVAHLLKVNLDNIYWKLEISNASLSIMDFYENNHFRLLTLNNTFYLY